LNEQLAKREASTPEPPTTCEVSEQWVGRIAVVAATGDVDMLSAPLLEKAIESAVSQDPTGLIVDLTDVAFLASAGMGVLMAAHDKKPATVDFCVVADGPATSRPLQLVGVADIIKLYPSRDEALACLTE
jgi:anti-sigma B factor antagonist